MTKRLGWAALYATFWWVVAAYASFFINFVATGEFEPSLLSTFMVAPAALIAAYRGATRHWRGRTEWRFANGPLSSRSARQEAEWRRAGDAESE
jgi:hypothetical protein